MSEICPNCGAVSVTELRTEEELITCYNCGEDFEEIPADDGMFVKAGWQEENARRQQLNRDYQSLDDGEEDPDLEDPDIEN